MMHYWKSSLYLFKLWEVKLPYETSCPFVGWLVRRCHNSLKGREYYTSMLQLHQCIVTMLCVCYAIIEE